MGAITIIYIPISIYFFKKVEDKWMKFKNYYFKSLLRATKGFFIFVSIIKWYKMV